MGRIERFEDIEAWKESCKLAIKIYEITQKGAFSKDFGLRDQIQRAAVSIASNIAEGFERDSNKEFVRFLYIAKGSSGEVRTQLHIAKSLGYLGEKDYTELINNVYHVSSMIGKFIKYLKGLRNTS
jgi:four helix bundle protein